MQLYNMSMVVALLSTLVSEVVAKWGCNICFSLWIEAVTFKAAKYLTQQR
jgi:hypothetical protein